jgi:DNA topoisomerase-1
MQLVLVESPTKSKTLQGFLGSKYRVYASYGHIRDLPERELGVNIKNEFKPKYIIIAKARKNIEYLKDQVPKFSNIILATDEDREGEAIAFHLKEALNLKNPKRIVFHEITKSAIEDALKNPRDIDVNLVDAQQARRILDRLVGYKLSPLLWKKVARGLSAGRVQSVAARLVVERQKEIDEFKPTEYWNIEAEFKNNPDFVATLTKKDNKTIPKIGIKTRNEGEKIIKDLKNTEYREKKEIKRYPFPPFTTSTLQQEASRKLRFSAKQTMFIAQQLYEGVSLKNKKSVGLITYMRTDSLNLAGQAIYKIRELIYKDFGKKYLPIKPNFYKTKSKTAQEAHEAIRPTFLEKKPEDIKQYLNKNKYSLYKWNRLFLTILLLISKPQKAKIITFTDSEPRGIF